MRLKLLKPKPFLFTTIIYKSPSRAVWRKQLGWILLHGLRSPGASSWVDCPHAGACPHRAALWCGPKSQLLSCLLVKGAVALVSWRACAGKLGFRLCVLALVSICTVKSPRWVASAVRTRGFRFMRLSFLIVRHKQCSPPHRGP